MDITRIGHAGYQKAAKKADLHSENLIKKGPNLDDLSGLKEAKQSAKAAARIMRIGQEVEDSLLDILA